MNRKRMLFILIGLMLPQTCLVHAMQEPVQLTQDSKGRSQDIRNEILLSLAGSVPYYRNIEQIDPHIQQINQLLNYGADLHYKDLEGQTPLHHAARAGNTVGVSTLIQAGANIEALDNNGQTPLHAAVSSGFLGANAIPILIAYGANINTPDKFELTPMQGARQSNNVQAIRALSTSVSPLELVSILPNLASIQHLINPALGQTVGSVVAAQLVPELVTQKLNAAKELLPRQEEELRQLIIQNISGVLRILLTRVSPSEIQHVIPAIIALTKKQNILGRDMGRLVAAQLIPEIVRDKLALAKKYFPDAPDAQLQRDIIYNINKAIKESPRIPKSASSSKN
ncbi:MAG: ankyrin repeat domain-containing protein [Candidatus Babeliales bacterium]